MRKKEKLLTDIADEAIDRDAVDRSFMGLTVACALPTTSSIRSDPRLLRTRRYLLLQRTYCPQRRT